MNDTQAFDDLYLRLLGACKSGDEEDFLLELRGRLWFDFLERIKHKRQEAWFMESRLHVVPQIREGKP